MDIEENFGEFRIEWYQVEVDRTNSKGTVAFLIKKKKRASHFRYRPIFGQETISIVSE